MGQTNGFHILTFASSRGSDLNMRPQGPGKDNAMKQTYDVAILKAFLYDSIEKSPRKARTIIYKKRRILCVVSMTLVRENKNFIVT